MAAPRRWQPLRPCDGSQFFVSAWLPAPPWPARRGSGAAGRHRRARLHELRPEHAVVRVARDAGRGRLPRRYDYYENNTLKATRSSTCPNVDSGSSWANWSGVATLQHGGQYGICAQGQYSFPNDSLFFPDGPNSCSMGTMLGRRAYTTIDRSKPTAAIHLAADAAFVKDTKIPLRVDFADDVAGPFPANFLCFQVGGGPHNLCDTSAGTSTATTRRARCPAAPASRPRSPAPPTTARSRTGPCGPACAPPTPRSRTTRTAPTRAARRTRPTCRIRTATAWSLDRTPPTVTIGVAAAAVKVGDLVSFQATAADATSGLAGAGQWTWGDNTGGGSGDAVSHTYTQAGTYEVALTVTDAAGNPATAKKTITVTGPAAGRRPPAAADDDARRRTPGRRHDDDAARPRRRRRRSGRRGRPRSSSTRLAAPALAPSRSRGADRERRGRVQLALLRGSRVVARASVKLAADGTADYRLKLPKGTKAGRYTLKATYRRSARRAA